MDLKIDKTIAWTDCTIVLSFLNREVKNWSTFVTDRTAELKKCFTLKWNLLKKFFGVGVRCSRTFQFTTPKLTLKFYLAQKKT